MFTYNRGIATHTCTCTSHTVSCKLITRALIVVLHSYPGCVHAQGGKVIGFVHLSVHLLIYYVQVKNFFMDLVPQPIRRNILPPMNWKQWRSFIFVHLPIIQWLWQYRPKQLIGDIIAGITIGVTHIPQGRV